MTKTVEATIERASGDVSKEDQSISKALAKDAATIRDRSDCETVLIFAKHNGALIVSGDAGIFDTCQAAKPPGFSRAL